MSTSKSDSEKVAPSHSKRGVIQLIPIPPSDPAKVIDTIDLTSSESETASNDNLEIPPISSSRFLRYLEEKWAGQRALKEVRELKDQLTCKLCFDNPVNITFVECGHLLACSACAVPLLSCPLCREPITIKQKTFM